MTSQNYKDLVVWQKAVTLAENIYTITKQFPKGESYGLSSQRCHVAGSRAEVETQFILANRSGYRSKETLTDTLALSNEIQRMTHTLIVRLK